MAEPGADKDLIVTARASAWATNSARPRPPRRRSAPPPGPRPGALPRLPAPAQAPHPSRRTRAPCRPASPGTRARERPEARCESSRRRPAPPPDPGAGALRPAPPPDWPLPSSWREGAPSHVPSRPCAAQNRFSRFLERARAFSSEVCLNFRNRRQMIPAVPTHNVHSLS